MGGHGGLNILPQKKWNVYNFDNREKVRLDEEAAAKEEQLKREQSRRRDTELRLEKLRQARGLASQHPPESDQKSPIETSTAPPPPPPPAAVSIAEPLNSSASDSKHINLFEGIRIFDPIKPGDEKRSEKRSRFARDDDKSKRMKKEEVRVVGPEDENLKFGYGVAGKGVKLPWYMAKRVADGNDDDDDEQEQRRKEKKRSSGGGKKTIEELREERLNRERKEKERERALLMMKNKKDGGFSSRRR